MQGVENNKMGQVKLVKLNCTPLKVNNDKIEFE